MGRNTQRTACWHLHCYLRGDSHSFGFNSMITSLRKLTLAAVSALALAGSAHAVNFDLTSSIAQLLGGNPGDAAFVDVREDGTVLGGATGLYTATVGGSGKDGYWVRIDFGSNPQPVLESAFLKAGNSHLFWDATDLAAFNAGTYTSITLWNSGSGGIKNPPGNAYLGTSHAGLEGKLGVPPPDVPPPSVPDGGLTLSFLGLGLAIIGGVRRVIRR